MNGVHKAELTRLMRCTRYFRHFNFTVTQISEHIKLVFQMTIRMSTCKDIADDKKVVRAIAEQYWAVEHSATPAFLLFPFLPTSMKKSKAKATTALYKILLSFVVQRRNSPHRTTDPIDLFISQGDSDDNIVGVSPIFYVTTPSSPIHYAVYRR